VPLRCYLLIGPPASGKTTLAKTLAPLLTAPGEPPALVLSTCLEWNRQRERQVPEAVIQEMAAALADPHFGPSRAEGFAALCAVVPTHHDDLEPLLAAELAALDLAWAGPR
jgi:predicted kinase